LKITTASTLAGFSIRTLDILMMLIKYLFRNLFNLFVLQKVYENPVFVLHDPFLILFMIITYSTFCIIFISKQGGLPSNQQSYSEKMVL